MDAENRLEKVRAAIGRLNPSVHACAFYSDRDEEVAMTATYVRAGLARKELCICVVDDGREPILGALASEGVDTEAELHEGRLVFFEKPLTRHLTTLDMLEKLEEWSEGARKAGHSGCRIAGEMTWALGDGGTLKQLAEFEAQVDLKRIFERHACIGLCQFDVRRFTPELLRQMIVLHPFVVVGDRVCRNPYHVPPERYLSPDWPQRETDWMITNLEQLQQAQDGLQESQQRYRSLARRTVQVQERERRDIARELHDRVGQALTAMRINMDLIRTRLGERDDSLIRARTEDSLQLIDSTFKAVENVMYELRPPMLDDHGLVAALRWHARQFTERAGIRVEVSGAESSRFDPEVEIALFRIAQEALNNVARHSQAKRVAIELRDAAGETVLTVADDGVGPGAERDRPGKTGFGLITMRERAEAVGGTLETSSEKERGMRITVKVPRGHARRADLT
jgi:signal transduction histidine kinase